MRLAPSGHITTFIASLITALTATLMAASLMPGSPATMTYCFQFCSSRTNGIINCLINCSVVNF